MNLTGLRVALYGRMLERSRASVTALIREQGGSVDLDLTRRTDVLVVGRGAIGLVPSGHMSRQLSRAVAQGIPVVGEGRISDLLDDIEPQRLTFPIDRIKPSPPDSMVQVLNAFDLVHATTDMCRFGDVETLRTAVALRDDGHEMSSIVRILLDARSAPPGRFRIITNDGEARLNWGDAITALDGQGILPLPQQPNLEDLFETALLAEAEGQLEIAARAYEQCALVDRRDPIAPFNLANVLVQLNRNTEAIDRYSQAIARDPILAESYYNLARLIEERGDIPLAMKNLRQALEIDPDYSEAMFNLAQLEMKNENPTRAIELFNDFLQHDPDPEWRAIAMKARSVAASM